MNIKCKLLAMAGGFTGTISQESFHTVAIPFHANIHSVGDHDHYCFYYMGTVGSTKTKINKESRELRWVSAKELDMLPNTPVNVKNLAKYAIESHGKRK